MSINEFFKKPDNIDGIYQYVIAGQTIILIMDLRTHFREHERAMDEN